MKPCLPTKKHRSFDWSAGPVRRLPVIGGIAALLLCASAPVGALAASDDEMIKAIESVQSPDYHGLDSYDMRQLMERYHVPGVSVAVIHDFRVVWAKGWGVTDAATVTPVTPDTLFQEIGRAHV